MLKVAIEQWDRAAVASWSPADPAECVTNAFYAYENALMAAAHAIGRRATTKHYEKAALAGDMFQRNELKTDVSEKIDELNELRKDVQYGEPGPELRSYDLEDLVAELEEFLDEVREVIDGLDS